jgi:hypothetical protein
MVKVTRFDLRPLPVYVASQFAIKGGRSDYVANALTRTTRPNSRPPSAKTLSRAHIQSNRARPRLAIALFREFAHNYNRLHFL